MLYCAAMQSMLQTDMPHAVLKELASDALQSLTNGMVCLLKSYSNPEICTQTRITGCNESLT